MIPFEEALRIIRDSIRSLGAETVSPVEADGRVLARPLKMRLDLPRYDQSAMDGIAVRAADLSGASMKSPIALDLIGEIAAGSAVRPRLRPGTAVKVFTGSMLPRGADTVVIKEVCRFEDERVHVGLAPGVGDNIRVRGEELRRGAPLFEAGDRLNPASVGLLAINGIRTVSVHVRPRVSLITMGDELLRPGESPSTGKIHDANGPALEAALIRAGVARVRRYQVGDKAADLKRTLARAIRNADLVITVGGASVGDHDHVEAVRRALGIRERFNRVAVKPGKPNIFGFTTDRIPVFGLPGNPVSALVSFEHFVLPALRIQQGLPAGGDTDLSAELTTRLEKRTERLEWVRGTLSEVEGVLQVTPTRGQGSHMLSGLAAADVLIAFPATAKRLEPGARVGYKLLEWSSSNFIDSV